MRARLLHLVLVALTLLTVSSAGQGFNQAHRWGGFSGFVATGGSPNLRYPRFGQGFRPRLHSGFFLSPQFGFRSRKAFAFGSFRGRPNPFYPSSFIGALGYPGAIFPSMYGSVPESSATARFVEQWKEHRPLSSNWSTSLPESALLSIGMPEEAVVKVLGLPLEKTSADAAVIWKYSSLSLRIENGKLTGVR